MTPEITTGLFTVLGATAGGLFSYLATREGRKLEKARKEIGRLCGQVAAYYTLEALYKEELAACDPAKRKARTIMEDMRGKVEELESLERPTMTKNKADQIREQWS